MAGSLNKVILIGNLGKDPEIRTTSEGKEVASFSIATTEVWKSKVNGEKKEKTEWHRIVLFKEGLVGIVKNYVKKGSKVYIEGQLQNRKWVDSNNQEKYTTEVVLQGFYANLILLDSKQGSIVMTLNNSNGNSNSNTIDFESAELDDEIPF